MNFPLTVSVHGIKEDIRHILYSVRNAEFFFKFIVKKFCRNSRHFCIRRIRTGNIVSFKIKRINRKAPQILNESVFRSGIRYAFYKINRHTTVLTGNLKINVSGRLKALKIYSFIGEKILVLKPLFRNLKVSYNIRVKRYFLRRKRKRLENVIRLKVILLHKRIIPGKFLRKNFLLVRSPGFFRLRNMIPRIGRNVLQLRTVYISWWYGRKSRLRIIMRPEPVFHSDTFPSLFQKRKSRKRLVIRRMNNFLFVAVIYFAFPGRKNTRNAGGINSFFFLIKLPARNLCFIQKLRTFSVRRIYLIRHFCKFIRKAVSSLTVQSLRKIQIFLMKRRQLAVTVH